MFGFDDIALMLLTGGFLGFGQTALNFAGSSLAYQDQKDLQKRAQKFEAKQAQINRDWMTEMSNSAHQREVADLRSAGLNPILTATGGSGASTPTGSTAVSGNMPDGPDYSGLGDAFSKGLLGSIKTGLDMYRVGASVDNTKAATELAKSESDLKDSQTIGQQLKNDFDAATLADKKAITSEERKQAELMREQAFDNLRILNKRAELESSDDWNSARLRAEEAKGEGKYTKEVFGSVNKLMNLLEKSSGSAKQINNYYGPAARPIGDGVY